MTGTEYSHALAALPFGKRLPGAVYLIDIGDDPRIPSLLRITVAELRKRLEIGAEFSLLKFHTASPKISFLAYPDFDKDPHPALAESVIRDASGRILGTATTQANGGSTTSTQYRDASGRLAGSATTQGNSSSSSHTTFRDASGRMAGRASSKVSGTGSHTTYRNSSGRLTGSQTTNGSSFGSFSGIQRDASGRLTGSSTVNGKCQSVTRMPAPPSIKK